MFSCDIDYFLCFEIYFACISIIVLADCLWNNLCGTCIRFTHVVFWNENHIYFWSESCKKGNKGGGVECQIKVSQNYSTYKNKNLFLYYEKVMCLNWIVWVLKLFLYFFLKIFEPFNCSKLEFAHFDIHIINQ